MAIPTLYTPAEIAQKLGVTLTTVYLWLRARKLHGMRAGVQWRITEEDLEAYLRRKRQ